MNKLTILLLYQIVPHSLENGLIPYWSYTTSYTKQINLKMAKQLSLPLPDGSTVPQLAFGLYKIPADEDGVSIVLEAIKVGTMWNQDGPHPLRPHLRSFSTARLHIIPLGWLSPL